MKETCHGDSYTPSSRVCTLLAQTELADVEKRHPMMSLLRGVPQGSPWTCLICAVYCLCYTELVKDAGFVVHAYADELKIYD